jgi:acyl carrier protein
MKQEILTPVIAAIAKQKQLDPEAISSGSQLKDLGISSLDAITIIYELEEEFDIEVPSDDLDNLDSVQDIVDSIFELIKAAG